MKGCLIAFAVFVIFLIVLGVGCGGYVAFKTRGLIAEVDQEMQQLHQTNERWPFELPEDGLLLEARVAIFLDVRDQARQPIAEFLASMDRLEGGQDLGMIEAFREGLGLMNKTLSAFRDVPALLNDGLIAREMSLDEYVWICETVHETLVKAERDGDAAAREIVLGLEEQNREVNIEVEDQRVSYHSLRRELERREGGWLPANLRLVVEHETAITESPARILLDAVVIQTIAPHEDRVDSGGDSGDDSGDMGK